MKNLFLKVILILFLFSLFPISDVVKGYSSDATRIYLLELKKFYESKLIPEDIYKEEVKKSLAKFQLTLGVDNTALTKPEKKPPVQTKPSIPANYLANKPQLPPNPLTQKNDTPLKPENPLAEKPWPKVVKEGQLTTKAVNNKEIITPPKKNQVPQIQWGEMNDYFHFSNIRYGQIKEKNPMGSTRIYDAILFDLRAKVSANMGTTMFTAKFLDDEGLGFPGANTLIELKHSRGSVQWQRGNRGKGNIPMMGIADEDQDLVKTIQVVKGFAAILN